MSTSGNTSWELTRNDIIAAAMRKLGALAKGQAPSTDDYSDNQVALNAVINMLVTDGMPLWKRTTQTVTPVLSQKNYTITDVIKIAQVVLKDTTSGVQYDLVEKSEYDFNRLPSTSTGLPVHFMFQPAIQDGTLSLWPLPDATTVSSKQILVIKQKEFDSFTSGSETPDFPPYWTQALIYYLAVAIAPEYGLPLQDRQMLLKEAQMYKDMASGYGDEDGSLFIAPDFLGKR
jgi:hypothetical protein